MAQFQYALFNRPAGVGATPAGFSVVLPRPEAGQPHHDTARHGIVVYGRELTAEETKQFELPMLIEGGDIEALAERVAQSMTRYASQWVKARSEWDSSTFQNEFCQTVQNRLKRVWEGLTPSIDDHVQFSNKVFSFLETIAG